MKNKVSKQAKSCEFIQHFQKQDHSSSLFLASQSKFEIATGMTKREGGSQAGSFYSQNHHCLGQYAIPNHELNQVCKRVSLDIFFRGTKVMEKTAVLPATTIEPSEMNVNIILNNKHFKTKTTTKTELPSYLRNVASLFIHGYVCSIIWLIIPGHC